MDVPALWIWLTWPWLMVAPVAEDVSVTATRRPVRSLDAPAAVSVIEADRLSVTPAVVLDDALRATPGFSLFRRSSSRTANPTAQGATLRGLSASGAGRTLVLADGLPVNDPFGGWVSWLRVPLAAVDRVEVARGALGDVYGPDAAGGVVQIFGREATAQWRARLVADAGGQDTSRASAWAGRAFGAHAWTVAAERFDSDGAIPVARDQRGPVDEPAGVSARGGLATLRVAAGPATAITARADVFDERRANGTRLQRNDTNIRQGSVEVSAGLGRGMLRARVARAGQSLDQTFTAVTADRARESLTSAQRVGSGRTLASAEWTGAAPRAAWLAGVEGRWNTGRNRELRYFAGSPAGFTEAGGEHRDLGAFVQAVVPAGAAGVLTLGTRLDAWRLALDGASPPRTDVRWSPRAAWSMPIGASQSLHASAYRAFRPPTLNELVRGFRVGNVQTLPNGALEPETLGGGEIAWHLQRGPASVRVVAFLTALDAAIVNLTTSVSPSLITRERRNAGRVRSRGLEVEAAWRVVAGVSLRGSATLTDATFVEADEPALAGKRVPQVPRWQGAVGADAAAGPVGGAFTLRAAGAQFDDDRNQFTLRRAVVADASAWWRVHRRLSVIGAVENVADAEYDVGRTPLRSVGTPRLARVGVRVEW